MKLNFRGGSLSLIGEGPKAGGAARITLDGRSRTVRLGASGRRTRQVEDDAKRRGLRLRAGAHAVAAKAV